MVLETTKLPEPYMFVAKEIHSPTTLQKADWPKDVSLNPVMPISPAATGEERVRDCESFDASSTLKAEY